MDAIRTARDGGRGQEARLTQLVASLSADYEQAQRAGDFGRLDKITRALHLQGADMPGPGPEIETNRRE